METGYPWSEHFHYCIHLKLDKWETMDLSYILYIKRLNVNNYILKKVQKLHGIQQYISRD